MKTTFYSLIVVPPQSPRIRWIHVSRRALLILVLAFVVSFFLTVFLCLNFTLPEKSESDRSRLRAENLALRIQNTNMEFQTRRLNEQLSRVEEVSERITATLQSD